MPTSLAPGFPCPIFPFPSYTNVAPLSFSLNQSTDALEMLFQVPPIWDGGAITHLGFRQTTLTGVAPVYRASLQGVDTSGLPDGSIKAAGAAFVDYTPTAGNNSTWQWLALGTSYTPSAGEYLCAVLKYQSGTIDASNFSSFGSNYGAGTIVTSMPTAVQNEAGGRSRQSIPPFFGWKTASGVYGFPGSGGGNVQYAVNSSPDEYATRLNLPAAWGTTYKIAGARVCLVTWASTQTFDLILYAADGTTVLHSVPYDSDLAGGSFSNRMITVWFDDAWLTALNFGTTYRLAVAPTGTSNLGIPVVDVASNADLAAYLGGTGCYASHRVDAGAWTDVTTRIVCIEPILAEWNQAAAGGGIPGFSSPLIRSLQ